VVLGLTKGEEPENRQRKARRQTEVKQGVERVSDEEAFVMEWTKSGRAPGKLGGTPARDQAEDLCLCSTWAKKLVDPRRVKIG